MERWLLISNCSTAGLANSFKLLHPHFDVDALDIWQYRHNVEEHDKRIDSYFRVVIHPEIPTVPNSKILSARNVSYIPGIHFDSYHPDLCYALASGRFVNGRLGEYHSIIAIAAFNEGLSLSQAKALYCAKTYEKVGYFKGWETQRDNFLNHFNAYGLDMRSHFQQWSRGKSSFMHSINHAKIEVIHSIAKQFMESCGLSTRASDVRPEDNLVKGPSFPVYNEIAEELDVDGSYLFKVIGEYRHDTLEEFLERSYAVYADTKDEITVGLAYQDRYESIQAIIRGEL